MITTGTFHKDPAESNVRYRCKNCGVAGSHDSFREVLPGVTLCLDGSRRHYEVKFDGEKEPRRFNHAPSHAEIVATIAEIEAAAKPAVAPKEEQPRSFRSSTRRRAARPDDAAESENRPAPEEVQPI